MQRRCDWGYKVGLYFEPYTNSLIVFDEADRFILTDTNKLATLMNSCLHVCLIATSDDEDIKGSQRAVVDTLKFTKYNYVTDAPKFQKIKLNVDEVVIVAEGKPACGTIDIQYTNNHVL